MHGDQTPLVVKEMGITHKEFFRLLPIALSGWTYTTTDTTAEATKEGGSVSIALGEQNERRIANIRLPVTRVQIHLSGLTEAESRDFLFRFDRTYQRGGG